MLNELKKIAKKSFKKNKMAICISLLLLVSLNVFIHKMPYTLFKPVCNRIINIGLLIGIVINLCYKNICLSAILVATLIIINYYGVKKYNVHAYNEKNTNKYLIEDNSIFSKLKIMLNKRLEHFENTDPNTTMNNEDATEAILDNLLDEGMALSIGDTSINIDPTDLSDTTTTMEGFTTTVPTINPVGPSMTLPNLAETALSDEIPPPPMPPMPPGMTMPNVAEVVAPPMPPGMTMPNVAEPSMSIPLGLGPLPTMPEKYTNFMSYELFNAQTNTVPESTKVDNTKSPVLGINEYCTQGTVLNSGTPMGYDDKCKTNCSSV